MSAEVKAPTWRMLSTKHPHYRLIWERSSGQCEVLVRWPPRPCGEPAEGIVEEAGPLHTAMCLGCRRLTFGLTPEERRELDARAASAQADLFGGGR